MAERVASNHVYVDAPREAVWAVLADVSSYAHWVVGSSRTVRTEGRWPDLGSRFHHIQGVGPLGIQDTTEVIESKKPERLVMEVRIRPLLVARVELALDPHGKGTWVTMRESPLRGIVGRYGGPLLEPALVLRNKESLRRLRRLAERQAAAGGAGTTAGRS